MTVPADWQGFAEVIGGASGALTGLLFVAVSLNASRIAGHQGLRASAGQTLVLFLTPLTMAAALLAPGQPDWVLGAELITIGLISSWVLFSVGRRKHALADEDLLLIAIFNRRAPNVVVMLLFVASGTVVACGADSAPRLLLLSIRAAAGQRHQIISGSVSHVSRWKLYEPCAACGRCRHPDARIRQARPPALCIAAGRFFDFTYPPDVLATTKPINLVRELCNVPRDAGRLMAVMRWLPGCHRRVKAGCHRRVNVGVGAVSDSAGS